MDHSNPKFIKYMQNRQPTNPVFLEVFKRMIKSGDLKGLSSEQALGEVIKTTEQIMESVREPKP